MSDALDQVRNELASWYAALEPRTRDFFEAVYARDRSIAAGAIGGELLSADDLDQHETLGALLGVDAESSVYDVMPYIGISGQPEIDPDDVVAGAHFVVRWAEVNYGAASSSHVSVLGVFDAGNNPQFMGEVTAAALDRNAEVSHELTVDPLTPGRYSLRIQHNRDGVDVASAAYATRDQGFQTMTELTFSVRDVDDPARQAAEADLGTWWDRQEQDARPPATDEDEDEPAPAPASAPASTTPTFTVPTEADDEGYLIRGGGRPPDSAGA
jgi:hypothetical protein